MTTWPHDPGGNPDNGCPGRDVAKDNTPGADHGIRADGNIWKDRGADPDQTARADRNLP